jgi:hypothetical protein
MRPFILIAVAVTCLNLASRSAKATEPVPPGEVTAVQRALDGYFFKLEFPQKEIQTFSTRGLGLYPLNYGHYFRKPGLFPYASAGVTISVLSTATQGLSGASAAGRLATGLKVEVTERLRASLEVGYTPWAAGFLVEGRDRPAKAGLGNGLDVSVGFEWL